MFMFTNKSWIAVFLLFIIYDYYGVIVYVLYTMLSETLEMKPT